jgi:hypothetical protein
MDKDRLKTLIDRFDHETDLDIKMLLANQMIDVVKAEIWKLVGEMRSQQPKPQKPKWALLQKNTP